MSLTAEQIVAGSKHKIVKVDMRPHLDGNVYLKT